MSCEMENIIVQIGSEIVTTYRNICCLCFRLQKTDMYIVRHESVPGNHCKILSTIVISQLLTKQNFNMF